MPMCIEQRIDDGYVMGNNAGRVEVANKGLSEIRGSNSKW